MMHKGVFIKGETALVTAITHRGHPSSPEDPDSITVSIYDHDNGPEVEDAPMLRDSVGHYHCDVDTSQISKVGKCKILVKVVTSGRASYGRGAFVLSEIK